MATSSSALMAKPRAVWSSHPYSMGEMVTIADVDIPGELIPLVASRSDAAMKSQQPRVFSQRSQPGTDDKDEEYEGDDANHKPES